MVVIMMAAVAMGGPKFEVPLFPIEEKWGETEKTTTVKAEQGVSMIIHR